MIAAPRRLPLGHPARHHPGQPALGWIGEPAFAWIVEPRGQPASRGDNPALVHSVALTRRLPGHHHPAHRARRAGAEVVRHPQGRGDALWIALPLYVFYKVTYPGDLAAQPRGERPAAAGRHRSRSPKASSRTTRRSCGCCSPRSDDGRVSRAEARAARQRLRAVAPGGAADHGAARRRRLPLDHPHPRGEPASSPASSGHTRFPLCEGDLDHVDRPDPHQGPLPRRAPPPRR